MACNAYSLVHVEDVSGSYLDINCLWFIDDNKGFGLLLRPWQQRSRSKMSYYAVSNVRVDICNGPHRLTPLLVDFCYQFYQLY